MHRQTALNILRSHRHELEQFGVKSIALFGSVVREEATPDSDVDILVEFGKPVGLFTFLRLQYHLEELMGKHADMITPAALRRQLRDRILQEAVYAE
jgi:predicted nucleotidyltransferase